MTPNSTPKIGQFSPVHIANNVLKRAFNTNTPITPMKLQRVLYIVAQEYAKLTGNPLFYEKFRAWEYGPVLRTIHDQYQTTGPNNIRHYTKNADNEGHMVDGKLHPKLKQALNLAWEQAHNLTAVELSNQLRTQNSAWYKAYITEQEYINFEHILEEVNLPVTPEAQ